MRIQNKVFVIVYRIGKSGLEFLCLKPNPEPGRNADYYVVTGSVEKNETSESSALREVEEEIGLASINIINLHNEIRYRDKITGQQNIELCYAVRVGEEIIKLN